MTVINNGDLLSLVIPKVFAGTCGMSRGVIAFTPPLPIARPLTAYPATLDGRAVVLTNVQPAGDGRSFTAEVLG